jgi:ATP-dependent Clp protease ATP-binding subunit ClpC
MLEHYTIRARRALFFARKEAGDLGAPNIGSEHLLLGLLREDFRIEESIPRADAARRIRERIEALSSRGMKLPDSVDMPLDLDCQRVFEEAEKLNPPLIGTEQLLLALLHQEKCLAAQVLVEQGFDLQKFRSRPAPLNPSDFE